MWRTSTYQMEPRPLPVFRIQHYPDDEAPAFERTEFPLVTFIPRVECESTGTNGKTSLVSPFGWVRLIALETDKARKYVDTSSGLRRIIVADSSISGYVSETMSSSDALPSGPT